MVVRLMVSQAMSIQDQCASMQNTVFSAGNPAPLTGGGLQNVTALQLNDQFSCENDYAPKVRKPYTISKQRERWTDEEHKKFVEALKLYGRAWRRIEEHVGSKTAVQIRSHAQKFFSKVVRESSGSNTSSVDPIEIPPPRPKRKPMHPYPRKLTLTHVKESSTPEQPSSPNVSVLEHENQSPKSVLSRVGSDTLGYTDSNSPNGSMSPITSSDYVNGESLCLLPEHKLPPTAILVSSTSSADYHFTKLELSSDNHNFVREGLAEEATPRSLKLFGRTVVVNDSNVSSSIPEQVTACKSLPDTNEGKPFTPFPRKFGVNEALSGNEECPWSHLQHKPQRTSFYLTQFQNEYSNSSDTGGSAGGPASCWAFYGGVQLLPVAPFHKQEAVEETKFQKEGSSSGSNSGSVNDGGDGEKNSDVDTQSRQNLFDKEEREHSQGLEFKMSKRSAFSELKAKSEKHARGFVPYRKRRMVELDTQSSSLTFEDGVNQQIRLCL